MEKVWIIKANLVGLLGFKDKQSMAGFDFLSNHSTIDSDCDV